MPSAAPSQSSPTWPTDRTTDLSAGQVWSTGALAETGASSSVASDEPQASSGLRRLVPLLIGIALAVLGVFAITLALGFWLGSRRERSVAIQADEQRSGLAPQVTVPTSQTATALGQPPTVQTAPLPQQQQTAPTAPPAQWGAAQASPSQPGVVTPPTQTPTAPTAPSLPPAVSPSPPPPQQPVSIASTRVIGQLDGVAVDELLASATTAMDRCRVQGQTLTVGVQLIVSPSFATGPRIAIAQPAHEELAHRDVARCCANAIRRTAGRSWQPEGNGIVNLEVALQGR